MLVMPEDADIHAGMRYSFAPHRIRRPYRLANPH